jgi:hypothetical protein
MSRSDDRVLIDRGRRAGLTTAELYAAMAMRPPEGRDRHPGQTDSNGFVSGVDPAGHRVYRPAGDEPRS